MVLRNFLTCVALLALVLTQGGFSAERVADDPDRATYVLCSGYTGTSYCDDADGKDRGASVNGYTLLTFIHEGTGAYSCTIRGALADERDEAADGDMSDVAGFIMGTIASTSEALIYPNANFDFVYVSCPTNPLTDVSIRVRRER